MNLLPALVVIIPILAAFALPAMGKQLKGKENYFTFLVTAFTLLLTLWMYPSITADKVLETTLETGFSINFVFRADALGFLVGLVSIVLWCLASVFSMEYMKEEHALCRYSIFSLLSLSGMLGVVYSGNLFTLYLFFELLALASYMMVIHEENKEAHNAGIVYLFMGIGGGLTLLLAILATYAITGSGDLAAISQGLKGHPLLPYIFWGYIIGFGVKAGIFPVYIWLPKAHPVAPSPASALLSGVMIKAGAYGIIRTVYNIIGLDVIKGQTIIVCLFVIALITIFLGSAVAIHQKELKKMLAYSSVSQIGYVLLGVTLLTPKGIAGSVLHIFNHAIIKGTLFLCAGAYIHQTGLRQLEDLKGIGKRMPVTTICFTLAGLSMIGIPPFNGFISKWYLALGSLEVLKYGSYSINTGMIAVATLLLSSFMNLVYYAPIIYSAWFKSGPGGWETAVVNDDPNYWMKVPLLILGFGTLFFGMFPQIPAGLAQQVSNFYF